MFTTLQVVGDSCTQLCTHKFERVGLPLYAIYSTTHCSTNVISYYCSPLEERKRFAGPE